MKTTPFTSTYSANLMGLSFLDFFDSRESLPYCPLISWPCLGIRAGSVLCLEKTHIIPNYYHFSELSDVFPHHHVRTVHRDQWGDQTQGH